MAPTTEPIAQTTRPDWANPDDRYDEMWNGELVMSPIAGYEHQRLVARLLLIIGQVIDFDADEVFPGYNVSDRREGWSHNYRIPDIAVYLAANTGVVHSAFAEAGPDLAVEITSPNENPHAKLDFYASVNTRELLIVRRDAGWRVELYRLSGTRLVQVGDVGPGDAAVTCETVGLALRVEDADPRPAIVVTHPATGREWRV